MPSRSVRSATALALAASATTFAYVGSAAPAQAAGYNGYCKTSSGVTVVVDFRGLGGGVAIRCAPARSGATGLDALHAAGIPVTGSTGMYGDSVVCTLYGKPKRVCPRMPPADAYWSYWHASNGGSWTYSSDGLKSRTVIPGGFEGWSFAQGANVAPGAAPSRPAAPKPPTSKPTHSTTTKSAPSRHTSTKAPTHHPAPGKRDGGASNGSGGSGGAAGAGQPSSTASGTADKGKAESGAAKGKAAKGKAAESSAASSQAAKSEAAERKSKSAKAEASAKSKAAQTSSSTAGNAATGTSSSVPTNAAGSPLANSDDLIKNSKKKDSSGINATTVVGGGVLAALVIGGGIVAVIRRRGLGQ